MNQDDDGLPFYHCHANRHGVESFIPVAGSQRCRRSPFVDRVADKVRTLAAVKPALVPLIVCIAVVVSACGKNPISETATGSGDATTSSGSTNLPSPTTADLVFCVSETNRYRSMRSRPAVSRSTTLEMFAADGAKGDGLSNLPHHHVTTTPLPGNGQWGENEVLRWPYNLSPTVQGIIAQAIASFYSEGPGGGHYENIVGAFTQLGCGIYVDTNGITIIQDFQ